jgi:FXSXX-COOH protein
VNSVISGDSSGQTSDQRAFATFDTPLNESVTDEEVDRILAGMTAPGQVPVAAFNSSI